MLSAACVAFAVFCVLPLASMIALSIRGSGAASFYTFLLLDARQRALLSNTAILATVTALAATCVGVPLGVALGRIALPFKPSLRIALAAPALLPPYVVGLAWMSIGGGAWVHGLPAAILVLTLVFYPLPMLATEAAIRRVEPHLEEAASLVATPGRVLWRITLPLIAPSVAAAALIVFVLATAEFGVPALLRVRVFTTEIFTAFAALYDFGRAAVLAVPLLMLATGVAVAAARLAGEGLIATRRGQVDAPPLAFESWRPFAVVASSGVIVMALVVPIAVLAYEASGVESWVRVVAGSRHAIANSLTLAAFGATAVTAVGLGLAYASARAARNVRLAADGLFLVFFAAPSTIVGIGLIGLWNRPGIAGTLYGTNAMFVLVYLARFVPVAALALAASVRSIPVSHEEAAAVSGAGWLRTVIHVVLPQIRLGLLATWVIVFILAIGELGASVLVTPPGESTLPIRIYTLIANAPPAHVAALALLQAAASFCPLAVIGFGLAWNRRA